MKKIALLLVAAVALAVASPAFAKTCPRLWKQIDAKLSAGEVPANVLEKVKALRNQGEADHKSGKHAASEAALLEALKLLGA